MARRSLESISSGNGEKQPSDAGSASCAVMRRDALTVAPLESGGQLPNSILRSDSIAGSLLLHSNRQARHVLSLHFPLSKSYTRGWLIS